MAQITRGATKSCLRRDHKEIGQIEWSIQDASANFAPLPIFRIDFANILNL